jgi:hypothetical protein
MKNAIAAVGLVHRGPWPSRPRLPGPYGTFGPQQNRGNTLSPPARGGSPAIPIDLRLGAGEGVVEEQALVMGTSLRVRQRWEANQGGRAMGALR